ncbi:MAG: hypothetical protein ACRCST_05685 [Turicibacter sp.]
MSLEPTKEASVETDIKLDIIRDGRLATWLFIIGCLFYFYAYNEEEQGIIDDTKTAVNGVHAAKALEIAAFILLIGVIIFAINAFRKLDLLVNKQQTNPTIIKGQNLVAFSNLIKVIGFAGAAAGYHIIADEEEKNQVK